MKSASTALLVGFSLSAALSQPVHVASVRTNLAIVDRARNRASVPLQFSHNGEFRAMLKDGDRWKLAPETLSHTGGSTNLEIEPNKLYFLSHREALTPPVQGRQVTNRLLASSLLLMGRVGSAAPGARAEIISGNFFLRSVLEPVPWDSKAKAYQTGLKVGFDSTNSAQALRQFFPLAVQLMGSNITVQPDVITITNAGPAGYQSATVSCAAYTTQAAVIAHYIGADQATDETCPVQIERLGVLGMVNLMFPTPFLFATLAGGCAGGALRLLKLRRRKRAEWYWLIPEGTLVGLVFVAAVSAGLGSVAGGAFSPGVVGSEIGAFAVAALTGFVGTSALDYLTRNLLKEDATT